MRRAILFGSLLLLMGCQLPAERETLRPLPPGGAPLPYAQLLTRARQQASIATEAYYRDNWVDLVSAARGLEETASYLLKADDVPSSHKDTLPVLSADLGKEARALREAAKKEDVKETSAILTRIHAKVRELRLSRAAIKPAPASIK